MTDPHITQRERVAASTLGLHACREVYASRRTDPAWRLFEQASAEDEAWDELQARRDRHRDYFDDAA